MFPDSSQVLLHDWSCWADLTLLTLWCLLVVSVWHHMKEIWNDWSMWLGMCKNIHSVPLDSKQESPTVGDNPVWCNWMETIHGSPQEEIDAYLLLRASQCTCLTLLMQTWCMMQSQGDPPVTFWNLSTRCPQIGSVSNEVKTKLQPVVPSSWWPDKLLRTWLTCIACSVLLVFPLMAHHGSLATINLSSWVAWFLTLTVNKPKNPAKSHPFIGSSDLHSVRDHICFQCSTVWFLSFDSVFHWFCLRESFCIIWCFGASVHLESLLFGSLEHLFVFGTLQFGDSEMCENCVQESCRPRHLMCNTSWFGGPAHIGVSLQAGWPTCP